MRRSPTTAGCVALLCSAAVSEEMLATLAGRPRAPGASGAVVVVRRASRHALFDLTDAGEAAHFLAPKVAGRLPAEATIVCVPRAIMAVRV